MSKKRDVTMFVEKVFDLYRMSKIEFFYDVDEDSNEFAIPLFPYHRIDETTLNRISVKLGLTKDEILNRDMDAAKKYWNKYSFFPLFSEYLSEWSWYSSYDDKMPSAEEFLIHMIFSEDEKYPAKERYDYQNIKNRMFEQIKEFDKLMPGAYHKNAEIKKLTIDTEVFFSFPKIAEMLNSFIDMVDYVKKQFFKAVNVGLEEDEINEYNFLVNYLYAVDVVMPSVVVTYDNVCKYRKAYQEENHKDFYSYVKIKRFIGSDPWRCKEFFDDMVIVKKIVDIFPESKARMREFAMRVSQFDCSFFWSDADELTRIYVSKKQEEMFDWAPYVEKINKLTKPVAKGGLKVCERNLCTSFSPEVIARIQRRVEVADGGNK